MVKESMEDDMGDGTWIGCDAKELAVILERLEGGNLLHPDFEYFGTLRQEVGDGRVKFHGNFWDYSHAFMVTTGDPELIHRFDAAIEKQLASEAYVEASVQNKQHHASWGYQR